MKDHSSATITIPLTAYQELKAEVETLRRKQTSLLDKRVPVTRYITDTHRIRRTNPFDRHVHREITWIDSELYVELSESYEKGLQQYLLDVHNKEEKLLDESAKWKRKYNSLSGHFNTTVKRLIDRIVKYMSLPFYKRRRKDLFKILEFLQDKQEFKDKFIDETVGSLDGKTQ